MKNSQAELFDLASTPFYSSLDARARELLKGARIEAPVYHSLSKRLDLHIHLPQILPLNGYRKLLDDLRLLLHCPVDLIIIPEQKRALFSTLHPYVQDLFEKNPFYSDLRRISFDLEEDRLVFHAEATDELEDQAARLLKDLEPFGFELDDFTFQRPEQREDRVIPLKSAPKAKNQPVSPKKSEGSRFSAKRKKSRSIEGPFIELKDLEQGMSSVCVKGHIFDIENRTFKNGRRLQTLYLSDYKDAFILKRFENRNNTVEDLDAIKPGMWIKAIGDVSYDEYARTNILTVSALETIEPDKRMDEAEEKRIEWHIHSNFSEMDGVCSIEDYIQTAWDWGMDAIAISDHAVVQAFPMAQHKVEALQRKDPDRKFKILYGSEMYMVDDHYKVLRNNDHRDLKDQEYVVFDVETTGLSNRFETLIEFGAVLIKNQEIIDRVQFFIDPKRSIPANISELTHIHNSDVLNAGDFSSHYQQLKDIFRDRVLVAHNASFDVGMINAACEANGLEPFDNPYIDTRDLAYSLMDLRGYRLENVAKHYDVPYDGQGAHRADYDAEVLSYVFLNMLKDLEEPTSLDEFDQVSQEGALRKIHPDHISVFAKNQQGIKDLFELISLSHTEYLSYAPGAGTGYPRIPRRILEEYHKRGNLLFGSSCQNSEIFEIARNRSHEELVEAMDFYDFIEVQPPAVYKNLLDAKLIANLDNLHQIYGFILEAARQKGKPVIASGDVHYIHPWQKRIRDIYINAKQIGNQRHPLFQYNQMQRKTHSAPDQHLLTTDEMLDAFSFLDPETARKIVIENPKALAEQVEICLPMKDRLYPPDIEGSDQKLRDICYENAKKKYGDPLPEKIEARLKRELDAIIGAGYYVVYYISHLLVKKSNEDGYLVGSRGSVGSSFVATMSGITEVNPLEPHYICPQCQYLEWNEDPSVSSGYDLPEKSCPVCGAKLQGEGQNIPFETFLGFEGDKVPDIDLNFSGDYQGSAHNFTKTIFGEDHVFRAGTVGTVQEKTAYGYVKGFEESMDLEPFSEAKRTDLAKGAEGVKRTTGQHPGGIVVVPTDMDVHDFTPVQYPANNPYAEWKTTHFDFHQIHDNILKFDILGHVDPTAMRMLERLSGLDVTGIPMNDPETMAIFSGTNSLGIQSADYTQRTGAAGIPEFGTSFVRGILELTKPTTFAELVSISGLSHGTDVWLNNAKDLIDQGICELKDVIGCRDDIMSDLIRYGLPSKTAFTIMESVRKGKGLKEEWETLMKEKNVPDWYIESCKKIKYMFPKAHAVAYVTMAVRIAWFKVHMPLYYYCQFFSIRCDAYDISTMTKGREAIRAKMDAIERAREIKSPSLTDKDLHVYDTLELALEMTSRGYTFSKMDINRSLASEFSVDPENQNALLPPFTSVDGLGESVAQSIVKAREESAFLSKQDLLSRTSLSKTLLEKLDELGALGGLEEENQMALF